MNELVAQLTAKVGLDEAVAEKTIGIILGFLRKEGPADTVQALIDKIPGAQAAIDASGAGRLLGGLLGGGLMALGGKLMGLEHLPAKWGPVRRQGHAPTQESTALSGDVGSLSDPTSPESAVGLGMGEIKGVARELFKFGRDKIGADQMGAIIAGTPGLSQFA